MVLPWVLNGAEPWCQSTFWVSAELAVAVNLTGQRRTNRRLLHPGASKLLERYLCFVQVGLLPPRRLRNGGFLVQIEHLVGMESH